MCWNKRPELWASVQRAEILTWKMRHNRRLTVEECIVWIHCQSEIKGNTWVLVHVGRNSINPTGWCQAFITNSPVTWISVLDHAPRNSDVAQFLPEDWWVVDELGWRMIDAAVRLEAWREVIGEDAERKFPSEIGIVPPSNRFEELKKRILVD